MLDLTPTATDRADAQAVLARNPGVESAGALGAISAHLTVAQHSNNPDEIAEAIRKAAALSDAWLAWAPDVRLLRRAAIMRSARGAIV